MASLLAIGAAQASPATRVVLVKDINPGSGSSLPSYLANINGTLFFNANDGIHGWELWKSDGKAAGTVLVKDINPAGGSDYNDGPYGLINIGGTLFFAADDVIHGPEIWKSDGTAAGTTLVKDINPGPAGSASGALTNFNGTLFFRADDGTHGDELWRSDGTSAGTTLVKDINPGAGSSNPGDGTGSTDVNGTLFFNADDGIHGWELWKSDGTAAGTTLVKDINPSGDSYPEYLTNLDGTLLFEASGRGLWKTDGTEAGTTLVKEIYAEQLTNVSGSLLFAGSDGSDGEGLWKSDGTAAGTTLVKDINLNADPALLANINGTLFFLGDDGISGFELWKSDGTAAGTSLVKDIEPGADGSYPYELTNVDGTLFFVAEGGLWKSDGTAAGTTLVKDNIYPGDLINIGGTLFFSADDVIHGRELWKTRPRIHKTKLRIP